MKQIVLAATFGLVASAAWAGGLSDPVVAPEVVLSQTVDSAGSDEWILALLVVLTIGLGITGN
ncbi:MAG: hypothetical protein LJE68_16290 [Rhodobacter sp.]|nr:hypothetical protein [Rhodobacter sp.]